ncbi:MAG: DUF4394 domain-containing protein [Myxococcales bacterium]|nr:DUF4394 domain-containing protein [Myxococcales bacterium]
MLQLRLHYVLPCALIACAADPEPVPSGGGAAIVLTSKRIVRLAGAEVTSAATITGVSGSLVGIDVRPADGVVYALSAAGALYTIDPATGVATAKSTLAADVADLTSPFTALAGTRFGLDFNPAVDRLRVVSTTGQNLRINVDTGATFTDTGISGAVSGYGAAAYTNSIAAACRTTLYGIDEASDRLVLQNPPNDGTTASVGGLGIDATSVLGFDVQTDAAGASTAMALLTAGGTLRLHAIDLGSGSAGAGAVIDLDDGETAIDLAIPVAGGAVTQAPGELFGLTESGKLLSFNRGTAAKACTSTAMSGIAAGERVVGIDFRPSTGALHALTHANGTGKLYTIDPRTGAASSGVTLSVPLAGTEFGMDFNPTGPVALRIISDTGQNLRVTDVATGATTADSTLNGASTAATAAAYTGSVPGATATTLYVLDTKLDRLRIQNPPNSGTLVDVGAFGVDLDGSAGFDIDGRDGVAFVVANVANATTSTLRTVDLTTGVMSAPLGTIGGGERLRGIARVP